MPYIHPNFQDCVIYLYPSRKAANLGEGFGGTGFLIAYPSEVQDYHYYAVTNLHVIEEAKSPVIRLNTRDGKSDPLEYEQGDWIPHPDGDDLAVCPIALPLTAYQNQALNWNLVALDQHLIRQAEVCAGADVFMVGRFISHDGKQRNTPALRFGNIAMMPEEPIRGYKGHEQECFLVEMRSMSGYSGSPVSLALPEPQYEPLARNPFPAAIPFKNILLLGVDCSHIPQDAAVMIPSDKDDEEDQEHPDGWYVKANTSMAAVIPTWRLKGLLEENEDLKMQRKIEDERRLAQKQRKERRSGFERDAKKPQEKSDITPAGFEDALKKVFPRPSESESESDET